MADSIGTTHLYEKIDTLGYGLFVPVFFFIVGMEMDLSLLWTFDVRNIILWAIVLGSILSKSISGYIGMRQQKYNSRHSAMFGIATTAQLTTTLAATYAASSLGVLDNTLVTSILVLSTITALGMPIIFHKVAHA